VSVETVQEVGMTILVVAAAVAPERVTPVTPGSAIKQILKDV